MADYTANYQLHQWQAEDSFLRADFNQDFQKIDAALKAVADSVPKLTLGSYTGTGGKGQSVPNTLTLSFPPKLLAVFPSSGSYRLLCVRGMAGSNTSPNGHSNGNVALAWDGSTVSWYTTDGGADADYQMNRANMQYIYLALG